MLKKQALLLLTITGYTAGAPRVELPNSYDIRPTIEGLSETTVQQIIAAIKASTLYDDVYNAIQDLGARSNELEQITSSLTQTVSQRTMSLSSQLTIIKDLQKNRSELMETVDTLLHRILHLASSDKTLS